MNQLGRIGKLNQKAKEIMNSDVMTPNELADYLQIHPMTLKRLEKRVDKPLIPIRINKRGDRRYLKSEIQNYFFGGENGKV